MGQGWRKVLSVLLTAAEISGIFSANQDRGNTNPTVRLSPDDPFYQEFVAVWYAKESAEVGSCGRRSVTCTSTSLGRY